MNRKAEKQESREEAGRRGSVVEFARRVTSLGEKAGKRDAADLRRRFQSYLRLCEEYGVKVGNMAAYAAMGTDHVTVERILAESGEDDPLRKLLSAVKRYCGLYRETLLEEGGVRESTGLFWQKTFDGVRDKETGAFFERQPEEREETPEELREKYRGLFLD